MREKSIENYFKTKVNNLGWLCFKLATPGTAGIPDRLVILPKGTIWFVELKQPKGRLEKIQKHIIKTLDTYECNTAVLKDKGDVDRWILSLTVTSNR